VKIMQARVKKSLEDIRAQVRLAEFNSAKAESIDRLTAALRLAAACSLLRQMLGQFSGG